MRYERPAQFNIREFFRPVAPLEVQYRVEDPGLLLSSFAMLDHFAMEPVRVMAFYKQEGDDLRLDWDVYAQTLEAIKQVFSELAVPYHLVYIFVGSPYHIGAGGLFGMVVAAFLAKPPLKVTL